MTMQPWQTSLAYAPLQAAFIRWVRTLCCCLHCCPAYCSDLYPPEPDRPRACPPAAAAAGTLVLHSLTLPRAPSSCMLVQLAQQTCLLHSCTALEPGFCKQSFEFSLTKASRPQRRAQVEAEGHNLKDWIDPEQENLSAKHASLTAILAELKPFEINAATMSQVWALAWHMEQDC